MAGNKCDVCRKSPTVGVACSSLGPISFAYCEECTKRYAEPLHLLIGMMQINGAESYEETMSWKDGEYLTWEQVLVELENAPPFEFPQEG